MFSTNGGHIKLQSPLYCRCDVNGTDTKKNQDNKVSLDIQKSPLTLNSKIIKQLDWPLWFLKTFFTTFVSAWFTAAISLALTKGVTLPPQLHCSPPMNVMACTKHLYVFICYQFTVLGELPKHYSTHPFYKIITNFYLLWNTKEALNYSHFLMGLVVRWLTSANTPHTAKCSAHD